MLANLMKLKIPILGVAILLGAILCFAYGSGKVENKTVAIEQLSEVQLNEIVGADPWGCDLVPTWCTSINYCTGCDDGTFFGDCSDSGRTGSGSAMGCIPADNDWICWHDSFACSFKYDCVPWDIPFVRCSFDCYFWDDFEDCPMCDFWGDPYDISWIDDDFCFPDIWEEEEVEPWEEWYEDYYTNHFDHSS